MTEVQHTNNTNDHVGVFQVRLGCPFQTFHRHSKFFAAKKQTNEPNSSLFYHMCSILIRIFSSPTGAVQLNVKVLRFSVQTVAWHVDLDTKNNEIQNKEDPPDLFLLFVYLQPLNKLASQRNLCLKIKNLIAYRPNMIQSTMEIMMEVVALLVKQL